MHSKLIFLVTQAISLAIFFPYFFFQDFTQGNFVTFSHNQNPKAATEELCSGRTAVPCSLPADECQASKGYLPSAPCGAGWAVITGDRHYSFITCLYIKKC